MGYEPEFAFAQLPDVDYSDERALTVIVQHNLTGHCFKSHLGLDVF